MKRSETQSIEAAFRAFLAEEPEFHEQLAEYKALSILPEVFGAMWSYVEKYRIYDGVLYLEVFSAPLRQSILLDKTMILERINTLVGVEILRDLSLR